MDLLQQTDELFFTRTNLDLDQTKKIVKAALAGGDDGELFLEMRHAEMLAFDDGRLKTASYDQSSGFGLRAVAGEAHGYAHAGELSEAALARAANSVSAVTKGYTGTAALAPSAGANIPLYSDQNPLNSTPFETKVKLLQEMDTYARESDPRVKQVSASLTGSWQAVQIIRADGLEGCRYSAVGPHQHLGCSGTGWPHGVGRHRCWWARDAGSMANPRKLAITGG